MQLKLKRREEISISSWINDREITSSEWEVYSHDVPNDDSILFYVVDKQSNNKVRIEIKKHTPFEEIREETKEETTNNQPTNENDKEEESKN